MRDSRLFTDGGENAKVIGHNTDTSGETYGILGKSDSTAGFGLYSPDNVKFGGDINAPNRCSIIINGRRALRLGVPGTDSNNNEAGSNIVAGHPSNTVDNNAVGVVIGGGGGYREDSPFDNDAGNTVSGNYATIGGGRKNSARAKRATIGGGELNQAEGEESIIGGGLGNITNGLHATVGGGDSNTASGEKATVGGGRRNEASGFKATVGGGEGNTANGNLATVSGGGTGNKASGRAATISGGGNNRATYNGTAIGGGKFNTASGTAATIAGGFENTASGEQSTVSGGIKNKASDTNSTVGGGRKNTASSIGATVPGGEFGMAESNNSFVWNDRSAYHEFNDGDSDPDGLSSEKAVNGEPVTGSNTFSVSAQGGVRFITGSSSVTYIDGGSTGWSTASSRTVKTNIDPVDSQQALANVEQLEVATWEYKGKDGDGAGTTHIGPMAEEFHDAFDVGASDGHINSINADGAAFAAIQGLSQKLTEKDARIDDLEADGVEKDARIENLETENAEKGAKLEHQQDRIDELEAENQQLRQRLTAIESELGIGATPEQPEPSSD